MSEVDALITLLDDDDAEVAALAMERLLSLKGLDPILRQQQESSSPNLRRRVREIETIISRQKALREFLERISNDRLDEWRDLAYLNALLDPTLEADEITSNFKALADKLSQRPGDAPTAICALLHELAYTVPEEDMLDPGLHMLAEVLAGYYGTSLMMCIIARQLGLTRGWRPDIVLYKGRHALFDAQGNFIDPSRGWQSSRRNAKLKVYRLGAREILLTVIAEHYLAALSQGNLKVLHTLSSILGRLSLLKPADFPYPLGEEAAPKGTAP